MKRPHVVFGCVIALSLMACVVGRRVYTVKDDTDHDGEPLNAGNVGAFITVRGTLL